MAKQHIVTLLTDFGTRDGYVASMKGVMLSIAENITTVDITHEIPPGDIMAGSFVLNQVLDYFPPGTVHLAVVDPGVGTDRRILGAQYSGQMVIAPDNGLVSMADANHPLEGIVSVRNQRFFLQPRVGRTFDGRDVMAPVAAALLAGRARLDQLGPPPDTYKLLELPQPQFDGTTLTAHVLYVDHFGNCVTNVSRESLTACLPRLANVAVWAGGATVGPLRSSFASVEQGRPVAMLDSLDLLEVAVNLARASDVLGLTVGDRVQIRYGDSPAAASAGG